MRTEADRMKFLNRINTVCRWFFEDLGGVPGRPWDLLRVEARHGARQLSAAPPTSDNFCHVQHEPECVAGAFDASGNDCTVPKVAPIGLVTL
jgi:hypothetical protein